MKYLKKFPNHTEYVGYTGSTVFITPNVSYCTQEDEVHFSSESPVPPTPVIHVTGVAVEPTDININVGSTTGLTAIVTPDDATDKSVTWSTSDSNVATVDANGVVTAVAAGNAVITVTTVDGGKTAQCAATVEEQPQPTPTTAITYTASEQLALVLTRFTPAATGHSFNDGVGVIEFASDVTEIGVEAFQNCQSLTSIDIPSSVTSIGNGAFNYCYRLTNITIPDSVTSFGNDAFSYCSGLTSIDIPDSVTSIGTDAFDYCKALTSVTIGTGITSIGDVAFQRCSSLTSITVNAVTPPSLGVDAFYPTNNCPIYVPCESIDDYKDASDWSDYETRIQCVTPPAPAASITYTAYNKLNVELSAFTPAATAETFADGVGTIEFNAPVTAIGDRAFVTKDALTSIVIPDSVTSIGPVAFAGCSGMTSCTIGSGVRSIGDSAFGDCRVLESVIIPNGVTSIGNFVFGNCFSLTSVTIPDSVTTIGPYAFGSCRNLKSIDIPDGVTSIGNMAFYECYGLTSINIPTGITIIDNYVFQNCTSLLSVDIPSGVRSIGHSAFAGCNSLESITCEATTPPTLGDYVFDNTNDCPIYVPCEKVEAYKEAWSNYSSRIQCATPPQPATPITYTAENKLNVDLTKFTPDAIDETYDATTKTGIISFNEPVTYIDYNAFYKCTGLTSIDIPDSVTNISYQAFYGCSSLTSVTLGNGLTIIGGLAFCNCYSLTSIVIPSSVTSIGNDTFNGCASLTSVTVNATTPATLGNDVFFDTNNCPIYVPCESVDDYKRDWSNYETRIQCPPQPTTAITYTAMGKLNVSQTSFNPNSTGETYDETTHTGVIEFNAPVTGIGDAAFMMNQDLMSIELPNSVTTIGQVAFGTCTNLESIDIPSGVTSIGSGAFQNCNSLASVTIGNGIIRISDVAFINCSGLTSITIEATTPPTLENDAFKNTNNCPIYVPCESVDDYKRDWSAYESRIQCVTPPTPSTAITYTAENKLWVNLEKFTPTATVETYDSATQTGVIEFSDNVTAIGGGVFQNSTLTSISLPNSIKEIGDNAFDSCENLTSIDIPNSVTSIGGYVFHSCTGLTSVTLGNGLTSIGEKAFEGCYNLTSIDIPDSVTTIGDSAFYDCIGLTSVALGNGVTSINQSAFGYCSSLTSIGIPDSVTSIDSGAFKNCTSLTSCTIGNGITSISERVFSYCSKLTNVTIPSNVTNIGYEAFAYCSGLESITCEATIPPTLGEYVFDDTNDCPIYVPCEKVEAYKETWSAYESRIKCPPQPVTATITYTAANKLNVALSAFTPSATSEDYDSATQTGVIGFTEPVTEIGVNAFGVKYDLMSIELPNSVTTIGNGAFGGCTGLTSATIGNGVTSIGGSAFMNCPSLTSIDIPSGVTSIGNWAFSDCTSLTSITVKATTPPTLGNSAFANTNDSPIYVPCESVNSYKSAWSAYAGRIQCATPPAPTTAITYTADNQIDVTSSDFMPEATGHSFNDGVGIIEFPLPVKDIYDHAFSGRSIKSINIPDSVTSIGYYVFDSCDSLTSATIGNGVTSIGDGTFRSCTSLTSIVIPSGVTTIGEQAFQTCTSLTSIAIPDSVTSIGEQAFVYCDSLASVTIGNGITSINEEAFNSCYDLASVTVNATEPPTLGVDVFDNTSDDLVIYVPSASVETYKEAENWSNYADRIQAMP